MIRVGLVSAPTLTREEIEDPARVDLGQHVPLGILALAAVVQARGHEVRVIDTNDVYLSFADRRGLATAVSEQLQALAPDVVGFGSISASYPLTIAMARELKRRSRSTICVLGGPQASAVAAATLSAFPEIDFVMRGEADLSFPDFLDRLASGTEVAATDGLTFRLDGDVGERPSGALPDLAQLPLPLYELSRHIRSDTTLALELGRGCPYACTFCSTNDFFRRRFRLKDPRQVLAEMRQLAGRYGVSKFELVHDMFTVDRRKVVELCDVFAAAGEPFVWSISARTDRVDPELLERLRDAGCRGVFYGIESGSQRLQKEIRKRLDLGAAREALKATSELGMRAVASLIIGFPEEELEDLRQTVDFFVDSLRLPRVTPQLHLLAPLAGTPLSRSHPLVPDLARSDLSADWGTAEERATIEQYPEVFSSFLALPSCLPRQVLAALREFLIESAVEARWLLVALHDEWHGLDLARRFWAWSGGARPSRRRLLDFVRGELLAETRAPRAVASLLRLYEAASEPMEPWPGLLPPGPPRPCLCPDARLVRLEVDYGALISALRDATDLAALGPVQQAYLVRSNGQRDDVVEVDLLLADLLDGCDGGRTVDELCSASPLPREEVLAALRQLQEAALVV